MIVGAATVAASVLALTVQPVPGILVAYGRYAVTQPGSSMTRAASGSSWTLKTSFTAPA